ncbi:hypothetical protein DPX16_23098 [Anabarilius grahami]|uniref:Uncharacterized protein n=1 Tax=Anabarilius grahami TaxID=495550 RepID=A0A3N0XHR9_ANAGA|nr:hypothetical protein DPX16_23098 [Anabarilius grahami]
MVSFIRVREGVGLVQRDDILNLFMLGLVFTTPTLSVVLLHSIQNVLVLLEEEYSEKCLVPTVKFSGTKALIKGCMSAEVSYAVDVVNAVQHFHALRKNAGSLLAGSCISITRKRCGSHVYSVDQY